MTTPRVVYCVEQRCTHFLAIVGPTEDPVFVCQAFPAGIPEQILTGQDRHLRPVPGDKGITYETVK